MTPQETFDKGVSLRLEGNELFKKAEYKEALTKYYHAILHLRTVGGQKNKAEFEANSNEQLVMIYNNMAAVNIKQNNWIRAMENSKKALELDGKNVKAKFRLAQAYMQQNDIDKAEPLLAQVLAVNPDDAAVKLEIAKLKKQSKSQEGKQKLVYQKMMAKMAQENQVDV
ncbi:uncharacterized protein BX664DRAFT_325231 [Halteromyces radiatus]|uniref:uncharacterized protein n=1 Tax=Halteromyces radiatus TaxID=101107 RepID=UPI00221E6D88|nr:uncharacterized protein BX664DRAFT_325231 [Halteromyces radiatus]KAI8096940.1 hypothetical protein BX664DRAFT_325231 [Halteromyces radiatus]